MDFGYANNTQTINIEQEPSGRLMDALIHLYVFDNPEHICFSNLQSKENPLKLTIYWRGLDYSKIENTHYSTNLIDAWKIVELYHEKEISLVIKPYPFQPFYRVGIEIAGGIEWNYATAETPELAICRAGLLGMELLTQ